MAEVHHAILADVDPVDPLGPEESPVRAAEILKDPGIPLHSQDPVLPRDPGVGHDDVRLRIAADTVRSPVLELVNRAQRLYHQVR
jgi:hypothetical protein